MTDAPEADVSTTSAKGLRDARASCPGGGQAACWPPSKWLLLLFLTLFPRPGFAEEPVAMEPVAALNRAIELNQLRPPALFGEYRVRGEQTITSSVLAARRIVFERGSTLKFAQTPDQRGKAILLLAEEIVSDSEEPGRLTWGPEPKPPAGPAGADAPRGEDNGGREGMPGGQGLPGSVGGRGPSGDPAPSLIVVARRISGELVVAFSGQDGVAGGIGGKGGDGGNGGFGSPASQSMFDCRRGAGDGASGGNGGQGGRGGDGGAGGSAGSLTVLLPADATPGELPMEVFISPGQPGSAGSGGPGGAPGNGGPRGQSARPFCADDGRDGPGGLPGPQGPPGTAGAPGAPGAYQLGRLPEDVIGQLLM